MSPGSYGCLYGPAGIGKTLVMAPLATLGLVIAPNAGGSLSIETFYGLRPKEERFPKDLSSAAAMVREGARTHGYIVLDDLSVLVDQCFSGDWNALGAELLDLRTACFDSAQAGAHIWAVCHEQPHRESSGKAVRGGPQLPGQYPEKWSSYCFTVLRMVADAAAAPWPYVAWSRARGDWIAKDRYNIFPDSCPANIAEGLRARGYAIPYPGGLDWAGKVVDGLAGRLAKLPDLGSWRTILRPAAEKMAKQDPRHVRWVLSDALHREMFRRAAVDLEAFFSEPEGAEEL